MLKKPLRKLLYDHGNLHENVNKLRLELDKVQTALDLDPSNLELWEEEASYLRAFTDASLLEENQATRNRIDCVTTTNGVSVDGDQVPLAFIDHYVEFLSQQGVTFNFNTIDQFCKHLSSDVANHMIRDVSDQEIREAMFVMRDNKAPGLDGYTAALFKEPWDIIATDVTKAIKEFFTNEVLLKELNHTILALIPKVTSPMKINDYSPISCCNILYKCISRIISNRMKDCLMELVSLNQSAFVHGRSISANILLTQELMNNYHLDRGTPRCMFKVDIQKAYDTFDWNFFHAVLIGFGFHPRMIGWIMECVTSTSFSLSINGSLYGYFKGKWGLRQGDLMSPYLFTLVMELNLINLCFADDLFLLAHGDVDSARVIMDTLVEFKEALRLTPSLPKSTAYFCNVLNYTKLDILNILPFEEDKLPVKYLGVPLVLSRFLYRDCKELMEKVKGRINDWKNKSLSFTGRVVRAINAEISLVSRRDKERSYYGSDGFIPINSMAALFGRSLFGERCHGDGGKSFSAGYNRSAKVKDINVNTSWSWPDAWMSKYPNLGTIDVPHLTNTNDRSDKVDWYHVVWFSQQIPRHAINLWLVIKQKLKTQDNLRQWDVWEQLKCFTGIPNIPSSLDAIMDSLLPLAKMRFARCVISKLVFTASCYFIWQERNHRLFMKTKRSQDHVIDVIKSTVRLKLLSCRFKKTPRVQTLCHLWELPTSRIHG
ncbi:protein LAZ1 [Tanacetum coccineum]